MARNDGEDLIGELDRYRRALLYLGGSCDWDAFHAKAAQLFEYLEATGIAALLKRRLYPAIAGVAIVLVAVFPLFGLLGSSGFPFLAGHQDAVAMAVLAVYACGLLSLLELRLYLSMRALRRKKREAEFIRSLEAAERTALGPDACSMPG